MPSFVTFPFIQCHHTCERAAGGGFANPSERESFAKSPAGAARQATTARARRRKPRLSRDNIPCKGFVWGAPDAHAAMSRTVGIMASRLFVMIAFIFADYLLQQSILRAYFNIPRFAWSIAYHSASIAPFSPDAVEVQFNRAAIAEKRSRFARDNSYNCYLYFHNHRFLLLFSGENAWYTKRKPSLRRGGHPIREVASLAEPDGTARNPL